MQMLDYLGRRNEVVLLLQQLGVWCVERVVEAHDMADLCKHHRECGTRTRPEIEAATVRSQTLRYRYEKSSQKTTVTKIVWRILMLEN